jgi:hypothetical protein
MEDLGYSYEISFIGYGAVYTILGPSTVDHKVRWTIVGNRVIERVEEHTLRYDRTTVTERVIIDSITRRISWKLAGIGFRLAEGGARLQGVGEVCLFEIVTRDGDIYIVSLTNEGWLVASDSGEKLVGGAAYQWLDNLFE